MKYLVVGAGGAGGVLGAALAEYGYDVTLIARGKHLQAIKENGLTIHQLWDEEEKTIHIPACSEDEYQDQADVIFVCVKGYSIPDVIPFLERASTTETVIIPILNIYTTGDTLRKALPDRYILDGCVYVSSNIESPGKILKHSKILRVIFGTAKNQESRPVLTQLEEELNNGFIKDCSQYKNAKLFVACGSGVYNILIELSKQEIINAPIVGIAHPSGQNMNWIKCYMKNKQANTKSLKKCEKMRNNAITTIQSLINQ